MDEDLGGGDDDDGGGGGAPAWMATFADLMSLLLCFFVLLLSFATLDEIVYKEVGGSMKNAFGVQSHVKLLQPVLGKNFIATEFSSGRPDPTILNVLPQENLDQRKIYDSQQIQPDATFEKMTAQDRATEQPSDPTEKQKDNQNETNDQVQLAKQTSEKELGVLTGTECGPMDAERSAILAHQVREVAQFANRKSKDLGRELASEIANGALEVETEGNKVIIRVAEDASFAPGSAQTLSSFNTVLEKISDVVQESPGNVVVEGHTDNIPITPDRFSSNWELSSSRAANVVTQLVSGSGLPLNRFEVRGFADTKPLASNITSIGRAKNRRVEIIIEYDEKNLEPVKLRSEIEEEKRAENRKQGVLESDDSLNAAITSAMNDDAPLPQTLNSTTTTPAEATNAQAEAASRKPQEKSQEKPSKIDFFGNLESLSPAPSQSKKATPEKSPSNFIFEGDFFQ
ncbi:MAG: MotB family protein [Bdellovibrionota bacterium]